MHPALPVVVTLLVLLATSPRARAAERIAGTGTAPEPAPPLGPVGRTLRYQPAVGADRAGSGIRDFTLGAGPVEVRNGRTFQWLSLDAVGGENRRFRAWFLTAEYPSPDLARARGTTARYVLQEGERSPVEYRDRTSDLALLPGMAGWPQLLPRPADAALAAPDFATPPPSVTFLGRPFAFVGSTLDSNPAPPPAGRTRRLRPDLLVGLPGNQRPKDDTRRYDGSDYEYVRLTGDDYREMAGAGINCLRVDAAQLPHVEDLDAFYWGVGPGEVPFPECLYRSTYLGPALFLDEPAVGTRDHVLRPRLAKDPDFRRQLTPTLALEAFRGHFADVLREGAPAQLGRLVRALPGTDPGSMNLTQANLYSWDTMPATAAHQLAQDPRVPAAMVFEPPGRLGSRRTLPELNMTYGCQIPIDDPGHLTRIIYGFLRGAARLTGKEWGTSVYGAVDTVDAPWFFTHAYDLGATRFFCWDNYQLACVPHAECLALARHLQAHAESHPRPDPARLRTAAEVLILIPPGYNLGHVHFGKGSLWGLPELNLERRNGAGVTYRAVLAAAFTEIERCLRLGTAFDLLWDLPDARPTGYREVVRILENASVEIRTGDIRTVRPDPRPPVRPDGPPPQLAVRLSAPGGAAPASLTAIATVVETAAPVYYTTGADPRGVHHNAIVDWELFGPDDPDYRPLPPPQHRPQVHTTAGTHEVRMSFVLERPGRYRLRAAVGDLAGRTTVAWTPIVVTE